MSKVKVLVVPSDRSGVGKFRSVDPHIFLQNQYPDEFHVDIIYEPSYEDFTFWTQYQIVAFHRSIGQDFEKAHRLIQMLNLLIFLRVVLKLMDFIMSPSKALRVVLGHFVNSFPRGAPIIFKN
jgi:hypothetical protein